MRRLFNLMKWPKPRRRRAIGRLSRHLIRDETGGEVMEYALILGLIIVGAITTIACFGTKVLSRWTSVSSKA